MIKHLPRKPDLLLVYRYPYIFTIPWDVVHYGPVESSTGIAPEA